MYIGQNDVLICEHRSGCAREDGVGQVLSGPVVGGMAGSADHGARRPVTCWTLSALQAKILEGVAAGFSSGRLSRELYFSAKTIDYHVRVMSDKLQVPNRVSLVSKAFVLELLRTDSWPPRVACDTVN
ncbi:LuxR C-terminal-related transcriptional regulator [Actinosynnema sp. NPDC023587]|uniref:LuxR C-terminal-related transcriptional regulator n=1 Tax=Actinosynnema sp. NPDC023587 TaxID=3154695 RepID=UPI0033BFD42D